MDKTIKETLLKLFKIKALLLYLITVLIIGIIPSYAYGLNTIPFKQRILIDDQEVQGNKFVTVKLLQGKNYLNWEETHAVAFKDSIISLNIGSKSPFTKTLLSQINIDRLDTDPLLFEFIIDFNRVTFPFNASFISLLSKGTYELTSLVTSQNIARDANISFSKLKITSKNISPLLSANDFNVIIPSSDIVIIENEGVSLLENDIGYLSTVNMTTVSQGILPITLGGLGHNNFTNNGLIFFDGNSMKTTLFQEDEILTNTRPVEFNRSVTIPNNNTVTITRSSNVNFNNFIHIKDGKIGIGTSTANSDIHVVGITKVNQVTFDDGSVLQTNLFENNQNLINSDNVIINAGDTSSILFRSGSNTIANFSEQKFEARANISANSLKLGSINALSVTLSNLISAVSLNVNMIEQGGAQPNDIIQYNGSNWSLLDNNSLIVTDNSILGSHITDGSITITKFPATAFGSGLSLNSQVELNIDDSKLTIDNNKLTIKRITSTDIQAQTILTHHIPSSAILSNLIRTGTILSKNLESHAINSQHITHTTIQESNIVTSAIKPRHIPARTIIPAHFQINSLNFDHTLASSAKFTSPFIATRAILATHIHNNAVNSQHIKSNEINAETISSNTITNKNIKPNQISAHHLASSSITEENISEGSLLSPQFQNNSITSRNIRNGEIDKFHISNNSILGDHISSNIVTSLNIQENSLGQSQLNTIILSTNKIKRGTLTETNLSNNQINSSHIQKNSITDSNLKNKSIREHHITSNSIQSRTFSNKSITSRHINSENILNRHLTPHSLLSTHFQEKSITSRNLSHNSISRRNIAKLSITKELIVSNSIDTHKFRNQSIISRHIQANSINSSHISSASITAIKIASLTLTSTNIDSHIISSNHLVNNLITREKINPRSITSRNINDAILNTAKLTTASITSSHFQANSITSTKIPLHSLLFEDFADFQSRTENQSHIDSNFFDDFSIISTNIVTAAITNRLIATHSIGILNIASGNILTPHIKNRSIFGSSIEEGAIITRTISANAIRNIHLTTGNFSAIESIATLNSLTILGTLTANIYIGDGSLLSNISGDFLPTNAITTIKIIDNSLESDKIADEGLFSNDFSPGQITSPLIAQRTLTNDDFSGTIPLSKFESLSPGNILIGSPTSILTAVTVTGDIRLTPTGNIRIENQKLNSTMFQLSSLEASHFIHYPKNSLIVGQGRSIAPEIKQISGILHLENGIVTNSIIADSISANAITSEHFTTTTRIIDSEKLESAIVDNSKINTSAGILFNKFEILPSGAILVGNRSNNVVTRSISGDFRLNNTGLFSINSAVITHNKLIGSEEGHILIGKGLSQATHYTGLTGNILIDKDGLTTLNSNLTVSTNQFIGFASNSLLIGQNAGAPPAIQVITGNFKLSGSQLTIATKSVTHNMLTSLPTNEILIGQGPGVSPASKPITGILNLNNTGLLNIRTGVITTNMLSPYPAGQVIIGQDTSVSAKAITGNFDLSSTGTLTLKDDSVTVSHLMRFEENNIIIGESGDAVVTFFDGDITSNLLTGPTPLLNLTINTGNITKEKLVNLPAGSILIGQEGIGENIATKSISGHFSLQQDGNIQINPNVITLNLLSSFPTSSILIGQSDTSPEPKLLTGALAFSNLPNQSNVLLIAPNVIQNNHIAKFPSGQIYIGQGLSREVETRPITGDFQLNQTGELTLNNNIISTNHLLQFESGGIIIGNGASATASVLFDYSNSDISISRNGVVTIASESITSLPSANVGQLLIGQGSSSSPLYKTVSGDFILTSTGNFKLHPTSISSTDIKNNILFDNDFSINNADRITLDKFEALNSGNIIISNIDGKFVEGTVTGHFSLDQSGLFKIRSAVLDNNQLKMNSVTSLNITDGTIKTEDIKNGSITGSNILNGELINRHFIDQSISINQFIVPAITTTYSVVVGDGRQNYYALITGNIVINENEGPVIPTNSILTNHILNNNIISRNIKNNAILAEHIRLGTLDNSSISQNMDSHNKINLSKLQDVNTYNILYANESSIISSLSTGQDFIITDIISGFIFTLNMIVSDNKILRSHVIKESLTSINFLGAISGDKFANESLVSTNLNINTTFNTNQVEDLQALKLFIGDNSGFLKQSLSGNFNYNNNGVFNLERFKITSNNIRDGEILLTDSDFLNIIQNEQIDETFISPNFLTNAKFMNDSITTEKLMDNAITSRNIKNNTIQIIKIANNAIDATRIISNNAITGQHFSDNSIIDPNIMNNAIKRNHFSLSITIDGKIQDGTIEGQDITENALDFSLPLLRKMDLSTKIAPGAITPNHIDSSNTFTFTNLELKNFTSTTSVTSSIKINSLALAEIISVNTTEYIANDIYIVSPTASYIEVDSCKVIILPVRNDNTINLALTPTKTFPIPGNSSTSDFGKMITIKTKKNPACVPFRVASIEQAQFKSTSIIGYFYNFNQDIDKFDHHYAIDPTIDQTHTFLLQDIRGKSYISPIIGGGNADYTFGKWTRIMRNADCPQFYIYETTERVYKSDIETNISDFDSNRDCLAQNIASDVTKSIGLNTEYSFETFGFSDWSKTNTITITKNNLEQFEIEHHHYYNDVLSFERLTYEHTLKTENLAGPEWITIGGDLGIKDLVSFVSKETVLINNGHATTINSVLGLSRHPFANEIKISHATENSSINLRWYFDEYKKNHIKVITGNIQEFTATKSIQNIASALHPATYPSKHAELFSISKKNDIKSLEVIFTTFNVEYASTCRFDFVNIYDKGASPFENKLCGDRNLTREDKISDTFKTTYYDFTHQKFIPEYRNNDFMFAFGTDSSVQKTGWNLEFREADYSTQNATPAPQNINSDNFAASYNANDYDVFRINRLPGDSLKHIQVKFTSFNVQNGGDTCTNDFLQIRTRSDGLLPEKYCGVINDNDADVLSQSLKDNFYNTTSNIFTRKFYDEDWINFSFDTNGSIENSGWELEYNVVTFSALVGTIATQTIDSNPGQANYSNNTYNVYRITPNPNTPNVLLNFNNFEIENDNATCSNQKDYVRIYTKFLSGKETESGFYCGTNKFNYSTAFDTDFKVWDLSSFKSKMYNFVEYVDVEFVTNATNPAPGFKLNYKIENIIQNEQFEEGCGNTFKCYRADIKEEDEKKVIPKRDGFQIQIEFTHFEVEFRAFSCGFDHVRIKSVGGNESAGWNNSDKICSESRAGNAIIHTNASASFGKIYDIGSNTFKTLLFDASTERVEIYFKTDGGVSHDGYQLEYSYIPI